MNWLGFHWDNIKGFREYYKLAKMYNKLYVQSQSPLFHYQLPKEEYVDVQKVSVPEYDFIPSYEGMEDPFHLLFIHISKSGGTTFEQPLDILKHHLIKECSVITDKYPKYNFCGTNFDPERDQTTIISNTCTVKTAAYESQVQTREDIIKQHIQKKSGDQKSIITGKLANQEVIDLVKSIEDTHSSFYCVHNTQWGSVSQLPHFQPSFDENKVIFCIIRNPKDRLLSHLKHKARKWDYEELIRNIDSKDSMFDNNIHKHLFEYGDRDKINCIDINDTKSLHALKSTYLSSAKLPNILQASRFNEGKERKPINITEKQLEEAFDRCIAKGYLEKDENIDFKFKKFISEGQRVHPLTFVVTKEERYGFIPTTDLFSKDFSLE